jgi:hypothetical protein
MSIIPSPSLLAPPQPIDPAVLAAAADLLAIPATTSPASTPTAAELAREHVLKLNNTAPLANPASFTPLVGARYWAVAERICHVITRDSITNEVTVEKLPTDVQNIIGVTVVHLLPESRLALCYTKWGEYLAFPYDNLIAIYNPPLWRRILIWLLLI